MRQIILYGSETWTHKENGIHSDDLGMKDFKENLRTKIWTRSVENMKQSATTKCI
jgi:hypothetical protein